CGVAALRPSRCSFAIDALHGATTLETCSTWSFFLTRTAAPPWDQPSSPGVLEEASRPAQRRPATKKLRRKKTHPANSIRKALQPEDGKHLWMPRSQSTS